MTAALKRPHSAVEELEARVAAVTLVDDRRSTHPIDVLSRDLDEVCTTAVSAHQIAALLEAEGLNDRIVQERYARTGVFALASDLHDRVPLRSSTERPIEAELASLGLQPSPLALAMRGPIYLVPVLFFISAAGLLGRGQVLWVGLLALLLAWAWNQGVGSLVHRLIGRGNIPGASRLARISLTAGTVAVTFIIWIAAFIAFGDPSVGLFAAGQTAYLIAVATLFTFGYDRLVTLALLPGVLVVLVSFVVPGVSDQAIVAATVGTLFLIVAAMIWATTDGHKAYIPKLTRFDLATAGSHALLGAAWALLIALAGLAIAGTAEVVMVVSLSAIPMVLTMGVAEWQLLRLRRQTRVLLMTTGNLEAFARRSRRAFFRATAVFSLSLIVVTLLVGFVMHLTGRLTESSAMLGFAFIWLGIAFFAGLALISMERIAIPLSASIYVAAILAYVLALTSVEAVVGAGLFVIGCSVLCLALVSAVVVVIPTAVLHR